MATIASSQAEQQSEQMRRRRIGWPSWAASYLQATPLFLILGFFFILPIAMIAVVSFWDYDFAGLYPAFLTMN